MKAKSLVAALGTFSAVVLANIVPVVPMVAGASAVEQIEQGTGTVSSASSGADLPSIASTVVNTMLFIVGILAVVMIIFSGIRYITAHGDKGQVESAKNTLIYSIVGLVIAIVAYAIVSWVTGLFGTSTGTNAAGGKTTSYVTAVIANMFS